MRIPLCSDEDNQRTRSTKKVKMLSDVGEVLMAAQNDEDQQMDTRQNVVNEDNLDDDNEIRSNSHMNRVKSPTSYKNMLLGVNGGSESSSEEVESWDDEDEEEADMQEDPINSTDPFCLVIDISSNER